MKTLLPRIVLALAASTCLSGLASACTAPQSTAGMTDSSVQSSSYENWGMYEWDSATEQWVKIASAFDPFFETETITSSDIFVPSSALGGGGGGAFII